MKRLKSLVAVAALSTIATAGVDTLQQGVKGYTGVQDMYVTTTVGAFAGSTEWGGAYAHPPTDPYTDKSMFTYENG